jgi:hypothetical protein
MNEAMQTMTGAPVPNEKREVDSKPDVPADGRPPVLDKSDQDERTPEEVGYGHGV